MKLVLSRLETGVGKCASNSKDAASNNVLDFSVQVSLVSNLCAMEINSSCRNNKKLPDILKR